MSEVRIIRTSALGDARARVQQWWGGLSTRERWLVGLLGGLLGALVLVFGIINPLQAARAQALADIRSYETLTARVRAAGVLMPVGSQPQLRSEPPAQAAEALARDAGLIVTAAPASAGITATLAEAPYEAVVGWIAAVERGTVLRARRVELRKGSGAGRVLASVEFGA